MYSPQLLDHFENPRNAGQLETPDAVARAENPVCGDVLELSVKIDQGRIVDIRFRAKGCAAAIACGSALTDMAKNKTIGEAEAIKREAIAEAVGGLPETSSHAAALAVEVFGTVLRSLPR